MVVVGARHLARVRATACPPTRNPPHVRMFAWSRVALADGVDRLIIVTNAEGSTNFKVCAAPVATPGAEHWVTIIPHSQERMIENVSCFANFVAVVGREGGFQNLWTACGADVSTALTSAAHAHLPLYRVPARDSVYVMDLDHGNMEYEAHTLRITYESPVTPKLTCELAVPSTHALECATWDALPLTVLKQQEVPNVNLSQYTTARISVATGGSAPVPVSLVYRPDLVSPGTPAPLLLYGYGSYGVCIDMNFSASVLSLCDRGVVYAVAHIRGGAELGRHWYEKEGKLLNKMNTFHDFIGVAEHLVASGWTSSNMLGAMGASAGGLLMGAVVNARPDLFRAIVSQVGFVDVVTTMSDPSIPLTVTEWEEWGNPNEAAYFEVRKPAHLRVHPFLAGALPRARAVVLGCPPCST